MFGMAQKKSGHSNEFLSLANSASYILTAAFPCAIFLEKNENRMYNRAK